MEKKNIFTTKFIAGVGILTAVEIVLYIIGAALPLGTININLALVPIALGAMFYGPFCGLFLGAVNGVATLLTPSVQSYFMNTELFGQWAILGTFLACLIKCSCAGFVSGLVYNVIKKKNEIVAIIVASLVVPVINTGIFLIFAAIFFKYDMAAIVATVFSVNFLIEFLSTLLLCPAIIRIIKIWNIKNGATTEGK
ncbi:MAG: ECF transporter S component [Bacilli bacterium]|nr:ECF transporter S component [Bacilli bacterium]